MAKHRQPHALHVFKNLRMQRAGENASKGRIMTTACGVSFKLNKPVKWQVCDLLNELERKGYLFVGCEQVRRPEKITISFLKELFRYADYLDNKAYFDRKAC